MVDIWLQNLCSHKQQWLDNITLKTLCF